MARDQAQSAPVYFAEKHLGPNYVPVLAWELYPHAKEIFLVRDLRDLASSMLAFSARRGPSSFGMEPGMTREQYLRERVRLVAWQLRKAWRSRRDRAHLLRYEDLVARPAETLGGVFEYLELEATAAEIDRILSIGAETAPTAAGWSHDDGLVAEHRTSETPEDSIGRWRREHDAEFRELLQEVLGDLLEDFGYARVSAE
jgi:hypothetical protein